MYVHGGFDCLSFFLLLLWSLKLYLSALLCPDTYTHTHTHTLTHTHTHTRTHMKPHHISHTHDRVMLLSVTATLNFLIALCVKFYYSSPFAFDFASNTTSTRSYAKHTHNNAYNMGITRHSYGVSSSAKLFQRDAEYV